MNREPVEHLTATTVAESVNLLDAMQRYRAPTDFALMLELWRSGVPQQREVALQMADDDRRRSAAA